MYVAARCIPTGYIRILGFLSHAQSQLIRQKRIPCLRYERFVGIQNIVTFGVAENSRIQSRDTVEIGKFRFFDARNSGGLKIAVAHEIAQFGIFDLFDQIAPTLVGILRVEYVRKFERAFRASFGHGYAVESNRRKLLVRRLLLFCQIICRRISASSRLSFGKSGHHVVCPRQIRYRNGFPRSVDGYSLGCRVTGKAVDHRLACFAVDVVIYRFGDIVFDRRAGYRFIAYIALAYV